jgi:hypothetical protein
MDRSTWAIAGLTILAVFAGAVIPVVTDVLRGQLERKQRIQDRRTDFQRETLLDLQDALYRYIRALSVLKGDYLRGKEGEPPPLRLFDNPWVIAQDAAARIVLLTARVDDESLRSLVESYRSTHSAMFQPDQSVADENAFEALTVMWELQRQANDCIGQLLRKL